MPIGNLQRPLDELPDEVASAEPGLLSIRQLLGPSGVGKTLVLGELEARLAERGLVPVKLDPPTRQDDSGLYAAMLAAAGLDARFSTGIVSRLRSEHLTWPRILESLSASLQDHADKIASDPNSPKNTTSWLFL